jgi:uncharacterized protein involved in cysteine biosynthesis
MLLILGLIGIGVLGFVTVVGAGMLILYASAMVMTYLPRWLYWLRAPFIALVLLITCGVWLAPIASLLHPRGPLVALGMVAAGVIGGDTWHAWRKKKAPPEQLERQVRHEWE